MKKYRVLKEMPFHEVGEEIPLDIDGLLIVNCYKLSLKSIGFSKLIKNGWIEEVNQGFKEEVEEIFSKDIKYLRIRECKDVLIRDIVNAHKEHSKRWALEAFRNACKYCGSDLLNIDEFKKAIEESN